LTYLLGGQPRLNFVETKTDNSSGKCLLLIRSQTTGRVQ